MLKQKAIDIIDGNSEAMVSMSRTLWENPEEPMKETFACETQKGYLRKQGFRIIENKEIPTAFIAEYGDGKPVFGLLGEYDALKDLSQKISAEKSIIQEGAPGHGCGHNLLGVACLGAAVAIKELIEKKEICGTIRYYGCPAEEMILGKVLMARVGMFDDLDACLAWHPSSMTMPWAGSHLSIYSAIFSFTGKGAHAGSSPHLGRSALDAVELMNVGANYMREHIPEQNRVHYIITKGGVEPNTVPAEASVWYNVRSLNKEMAHETFRWLAEIAKGAAMMTQTTLSGIKIISGAYEVLSNQTLVKVIEENMTALGAPGFTDEDRSFAKAISEKFDRPQKENAFRSNFIPASLMDAYLHEGVEPPHDFGMTLKASTDAGDVSWITPFAMFGVATWPLGVVAHTWQATAASGSGIGFHAMLFAAKVMAASLIDIYTNESILEKAKTEFAESTKGKKYIAALDEEF